MKNIDQLIERSRQLASSSILNAPLREEGEEFVALRNSDRLIVMPIWQHPIDPIEGRLYGEYIAKQPKYKSVYVRKKIAFLLKVAASNLPKRYRLIVRAGHRPLVVQKKLLNNVAADFLRKNPGSTKKQSLDFARTYVSDPGTATPPHCCGAAVDVDLLDTKTNRLVDFGCPINTDSEAAFLHSSFITAEQYSNRMLLLKVMLGAGFASHAAEWWHYSYGDQRWAWFYGKNAALYDRCEPKV